MFHRAGMHSHFANLNTTYPVSWVFVSKRLSQIHSCHSRSPSRQRHDGIQYHHHHLPAGRPCLLFSVCLSPDWHHHPHLGICAGLPREPVCGLVGALPGQEALSDLFVGAEPGSGRCLCSAQRPSFSAVPGWRPRLGVWLSSVQTGALPVKCEHVRLHLPHLPDEHGPLAGCHEAFSFPENEDQAFPPGSPACGLGDGVHPVTADAFLPQVRLNFYFVPTCCKH